MTKHQTFLPSANLPCNNAAVESRQDNQDVIRVWALGDPHLSLANPKPMDIFGSSWLDHPKKIERNVRNLVGEDDILLIPGDISWAMRRAEAELDLSYLAELPGTKILIKGNHDYWWPSDKRLAFPGLHDTPWISEDGRVGVAGTRGWDPLQDGASEQERAGHEKHVNKELSRLQKRLDAIKGCEIKFAMIHHPPLPEFVSVLKGAGVESVVYGHLHLGGRGGPLPESWLGLKCFCVAADRISFTPRLISTFAR